jgi:hypothetical protein
MTLTEELNSLSTETLKTILSKLKKEEKDIKNGKRRDFFTSQYLEHSNVEFVNLLNKHFYSMRDKVLLKAEKFRNDDKNIDKYQLNHRKEKMQRLDEYMALAFPEITDDLWEVELEIKLVIKALKAKGSE